MAVVSAANLTAKSVSEWIGIVSAYVEKTTSSATFDGGSLKVGRCCLISVFSSTK